MDALRDSSRKVREDAITGSPFELPINGVSPSASDR